MKDKVYNTWKELGGIVEKVCQEHEAQKDTESAQKEEKKSKHPKRKRKEDSQPRKKPKLPEQTTATMSSPNPTITLDQPRASQHQLHTEEPLNPLLVEDTVQKLFDYMDSFSTNFCW